MSLKNRLKRVENKATPTKYAKMEDVLRIMHLEKQKTRTDDEEKRLMELKKMPIDPELEKALAKIRKDRDTPRKVTKSNEK